MLDTYPAEAATISCREALVKADRTAQNISVNMRITTMLLGLVAIVPAWENLYSKKIGMMRRARIIRVIIMVAQVAIRPRS